MSRKGVVLGTAGHVDHGKTALVRALTGVETDRWREERERGLTIDIGFARLSVDDEIETGIVDVPGHEDFLKNMLAGATGIDLLLLVVAADEGPMPQTREHLEIARLLGITEGIVALTKIDRVDDEWRQLAEETVGELLTETVGGARWPIVPVSSQTGAGLELLMERIRTAVRDKRERPSGDLFRLPVDRAFSVHGTGTVVTGTVWSGSIRVGDEVRVLPDDQIARVRALQVHGDARQIVEAGRRCATALVGVDPGRVQRGSTVVADTGWKGRQRLGVRLRCTRSVSRLIVHDQRVRIYLGTGEVMGRVLLPDGGALAPGDEAWACLRLEQPLTARARDRFILRFYSPVTTIGGGEVAELDPPPGWTARTEAWTAVLAGADEEVFAAVIRLAGGTGVVGSDLPMRCGLPPGRLERLADEAGEELLRIRDVWFDRMALADAGGHLRGELARLRDLDRRLPFVSLEALRTSGARAYAPELIDEAIAASARAGELIVDGPRVRLPTWRSELSPAESEARESVERAIRNGAMQPPTVSDLKKSLRLDRELLDDLLLLLTEDGIIVPITPEIYVARTVEREIIERTRAFLAPGEVVAPTAFKAVLEVPRKYLIPILEHMDRTGVTRRTAEGRELAG